MTLPEDPRLRDLLRSAAQSTSAPVGLADRLVASVHAAPAPRTGRGLRRAVAPMVAAAAVAAVAVGTLVIATQSRHATPPAHTPTPAPAPTSALPTLSPTTSPRTPTSTPTTARPPVVQGFSITNVSFTSPSLGWALGDGQCPTGTALDCATLLRTTDGGQHWTHRTVPAGVVSTKDFGSCGNNGDILGPCIDGVMFADANNGYVWGYHDFYATHDGGQHWTNQNTQYVDDVVAVGQNVVRLRSLLLCAGGGCLFELQTAHIGSNDWQTVTPGAGVPTFGVDLTAADGRAYYLSSPRTYSSPDLRSSSHSSPQYLYTSTDGTSWTRVNQDVCGQQTARLAAGPTGVLAVECLTGYQQQGSTVRVSADLGVTFSPGRLLPSGADGSNSPIVVALSATRVIASLNLPSDTTYLSTDGGGHWSPVDDLQSKYVGPTVQFVSSTTGFRPAVDGSYLSITSDGGQTWRHIVP